MDPTVQRVNVNMALFLMLALVATFLLFWGGHVAYMTELMR